MFRELTRVKQYFEKIKALETPPEKRTMTLDKQAAGRFIKHGLVSTPRITTGADLADTVQEGNDKIDLARAEREAKEKAMAQLRAAQFARKKTAIPQKRAAEEEAEPASNDNNIVKGTDFEAEVDKMIRAEAGASAPVDEVPSTTPTATDEMPEKNGKKRKKSKADKKRQKRLAKQQEMTASQAQE